MELVMKGHGINKIDYMNTYAKSTTIGDSVSIDCGELQTVLSGNDHFHVSSTKGSGNLQTSRNCSLLVQEKAFFTTMAIKDQIYPFCSTPFSEVNWSPTPTKALKKKVKVINNHQVYK
jgi:3-oxoacyl-[acyl-carrier-protein] synthase II